MTMINMEYANEEFKRCSYCNMSSLAKCWDIANVRRIKNNLKPLCPVCGKGTEK